MAVHGQRPFQQNQDFDRKTVLRIGVGYPGYISIPALFPVYILLLIFDSKLQWRRLSPMSKAVLVLPRGHFFQFLARRFAGEWTVRHGGRDRDASGRC